MNPDKNQIDHFRRRKILNSYVRDSFQSRLASRVSVSGRPGFVQLPLLVHFKIMKQILTLSFLSFGLFLDANALAQPTSEMEFVDRYENMFKNRPPLEGTNLPDARGYLADGSEFSIKQTKGKHTVLVFGCLT